jgi:hypothetical protein
MSKIIAYSVETGYYKTPEKAEPILILKIMRFKAQFGCLCGWSSLRYLPPPYLRQDPKKQMDRKFTSLSLIRLRCY